jgi:hypothetical protein
MAIPLHRCLHIAPHVHVSPDRCRIVAGEQVGVQHPPNSVK